jgi:hypothetical protein
VKDRKKKGGGLAAARHRAGEEIAALERGRDGVSLNRRRPREPEIFEASEQTWMELEMAERHGLLSQVPVNHQGAKICTFKDTSCIFVCFVLRDHA